MGQYFYFLTLVSFVCYMFMGILFGFQYVHYMEHKVKKTRFSYFRYVITIILILLLALVIAETNGFEKKTWLLDFFPLSIMILSIYLTVKFLFKKKHINFTNKT